MSSYYEYLFLENLKKSNTDEMKIGVIKSIGRIKSQRAIPEITNIATSDRYSTAVRIAAILALTNIGDKKFIKNFVPLANQENTDILEVLIRAIGKLNLYEYVSEFENFINYKNRAVKKEIINSLFLLDNVDSIRILVKFYSDKDIEIKQLVKYSIKSMNSFSDYLNSIDEQEILNVLSLVPVERAELLIEKLIKSSDDSKILNIIIKAIGDLQLSKGQEILEELFEKVEQKSIKLKIIEALEDIAAERKKDFLLKILAEEDDRDIRVRALFSFGCAAKCDEVIKVIKEIINNLDEWWMTRKVAIMLIGENRIKSEVSFLLEILKSENDSRVVRTLIHELGELGSSDAIKYLRKFLDSNELEIKKITILALSKLGDKDILEILLKDKEARERLMPESLKAIINFNDERIIGILTEMIENNEVESRMISLALDGIAVFTDGKIKKCVIKYVSDKDNKREYRAKGLMLLANYKDQEVVNFLKKIFKDANEWWMLKKIAVMIVDELKIYDLINEITEYAVDIDERISKSAKKAAKNFYNDYFLERVEQEDKDLAIIGSLYSKLL